MSNSKFAKLLFTFIAGMANVKQGYWPGILLYFSVMILLGVGLIFVERIFIEPIYHIPQSGRAFVLLMFLAFTFFWDGTHLLNYEEKDQLVNHGEGVSATKIRE